MRILIMSVTAGEGHNSTAKAMKDYFDRHGAVCTVLDTYKYASPAVAKLISEGYLIVSNKVKYAFQAGYRMAEKRHGGTGELSVARIVNRPFSDELYEFIAGFDPDAVIFTHPFAGMIMDIMAERHAPDTKVIGVLTDFVFHPYWEECRLCDYVITPSPVLDYQARQKGLEPTRVLPLGIPINEKFAKSADKREAREKLGLDPDADTVLVMGGSMGYGHMEKTVRSLDALELPRPMQILCVCGRNDDMKEKIGKLSVQSAHRIEVFGFVDNVDELMDASDCIVSKPGGLTTSEALAKRLPMIIVDPIPGQESRNTEFLLNNGAALASSNTLPVAELAYALLTNPDRMRTIRDAIEVLRRPNSAANVCEFVMRLVRESGADENK